MTTSKQEFVRTFLPDTVQNVNFAQIDLDITDLSIADVLRNVNKTFPKNTRIRNAIASGQHAVGVLCKTELLYPIAGLLLIVTGNDTDIEIVSKNYIVISVQEDMLTNDDDIKHIIDGITKYIVVSFRDCIAKFNDFYAKFIYDPYEMEIDPTESDEDYLEELYKKYRNSNK
jgi:hypothetical protein